MMLIDTITHLNNSYIDDDVYYDDGDDDDDVYDGVYDLDHLQVQYQYQYYQV